MNKTEQWRRVILATVTSNIVFVAAIYIANEFYFRGSLGWVLLIGYAIWIGFTFASWALRTISETVTYFINKKRDIRNFVTALHKNKIKIYEAFDIDIFDVSETFHHIIKHERDIDRDAYSFILAESLFHSILLTQQRYAAAFRVAMIQDEGYRQYKKEVYAQSLTDRIVTDPHKDG